MPSGRGNHSVLRRRVLTALVGIPVVLAAIWFGAPWLTILAAAAAVIGVREAYRLYPPAGLTGDDSPTTALPVLLGGTWAVALVLAGELAVHPPRFRAGGGRNLRGRRHHRQLVAGCGVARTPARAGRGLACWRRRCTSAARWPAPRRCGAWSGPLAAERASGCCRTLPAAGSPRARLAAPDYGAWWLLLGILTVYAADSGAFFVGRRIGRHPMSPGVSPGKTWEGTAGGLVGAVIAAVALGVLFPMRLDVWQLAVIGVILGVVSPAGDLLESKIKRMADVKDSGSLLPGHGGMLDRLDSLLPALIFVYILAVLAAAAD